MTPQERQQRLQVILDQHNQIARELRESTEHIREGHQHLEAVSARIADTHEAIVKATTAMIAANEAAMALFNEPASEE